MRRPRRDEDATQAGFTLVELITAIVLLGVVSGAVMVFITSNLRVYTNAAAKSYLIGQAQSGLDRINGDILMAAAADDTNRVADSNGPGGNSYGWQGGANTLILATAAVDSSNNIIFADASKYISQKNNTIYYLDGTDLRRRVLAAPVSGNSAVTTCPPAQATSSCPADPLVLQNVQSFNVVYRDHLDQTVDPSNSRSVEVSVTLQDSRRSATVSYTTRTVFRNK